MIIVGIPKTPLATQRLELDGDGIEYILRTRWVSSYQKFYMDILDSDGVLLSSSIKIVPGASLNLSQVRVDGPQGVFTVTGTGELTRSSFSDGSYQMYYTSRQGNQKFPLLIDYLTSDEVGIPIAETVILPELYNANTAKTDGISKLLYREAMTPSAAGYTVQGWFKIQSGLVGRKSIMVQRSDDPSSDILFNIEVQDNTTDVTFSATLINDAAELITIVGGTFAYDQEVHVLFTVSTTEARLFTNGVKYNTEIAHVPSVEDDSLVPMEFHTIVFHDNPITDQYALDFYNEGQARCNDSVDPELLVDNTAWHYCANWFGTLGQELDNQGSDGIELVNQDNLTFTGTSNIICVGELLPSATISFAPVSGLIVGMAETKVGDITTVIDSAGYPAEDFSISLVGDVQLLNDTEVHSVGVVTNETFQILLIHNTIGTIESIFRTVSAATNASAVIGFTPTSGDVEGDPSGKIGDLSVTPDDGRLNSNQFTLDFIAGAGDTNNSELTIVNGTEVHSIGIKQDADFRVSATHSYTGYVSQEAFSVDMYDGNATMTLLADPTAVEGSIAGKIADVTVVPNAAGTVPGDYEITLVSGTGDTHNGVVQVLNDTEIHSTSTMGDVDIRLRVTYTPSGVFYEEAFNVDMYDGNATMTLLADPTAAEGDPTGKIADVTIIPDEAGTILGDYVLTLVSGTGDTDNGSVQILNDTEVHSIGSMADADIRLRVTYTPSGVFYEEAFSVDIAAATTGRLYQSDSQDDKYYELSTSTMLDISGGGVSSIGTLPIGMGGSGSRLYTDDTTAALIYELSPSTMLDISGGGVATPETNTKGTGGTVTQLYHVGLTTNTETIYELSPITMLDISGGGVVPPGNGGGSVGGIDSQLYHVDFEVGTVYELSTSTMLDISGGGVSSPEISPVGIGGTSNRLYLTSRDTFNNYELSPSTMLDISGGGVAVTTTGNRDIGGTKPYVADHSFTSIFTLDGTVEEGDPAGIIGTVDVTPTDGGVLASEYTITLVTGTGDTDNGAVQILNSDEVHSIGVTADVDFRVQITHNVSGYYQQQAFSADLPVAATNQLFNGDTSSDKIYELSPSTMLDISGGGVTAPSTIPVGVGGTGTQLFNTNNTVDKIYELSPSTMLDISGGGVTTPSTGPRGIGGTTTQLFHVDATSDKIYEVSPTTMLDISGGGVAAPTNLSDGLGGTDTQLFLTENTGNKIYELSTSTMLDISGGGVAAPSTGPQGVGGTTTQLFHADIIEDKIYELSTSTMLDISGGGVASTSTSPHGIGGTKS